MKRIILFVACVLFSGCAKKETPPASPSNRDTVTQVSLLSDFKQGAYAGRIRLAELMQHGNIGIGTFDGLDGEMMTLDGHVYRFAADGTASEVDATNTTPSATMTFFEPDTTFDVGEMDDAVFRKTMDWKRPPGVEVVTFRISGRFDSVKTRSQARQSPPFRPLNTLTNALVESEWRDTVGTMVGFYFPDAWKDINWPGYHLHFIDQDHKHGGHVESFRLHQGRIEIDTCNAVQILLSTNVPGTLATPP